MSSSAAVANVNPAPVDLIDQFSMFPNEALDLSLLDPYELSAYSHLWRLTRGFHVFSKRVSIDKLSTKTKIGRTKLKEVLHSLSDMKLIEIEETQGRTNNYTVHAPREVNRLMPQLKQVANISSPDTDTQIDITVPVTQTHTESLQMQASRAATEPSRSTTPLKETPKKEEIEQHTPVVGVDDGPILPLNDIVDGIGFVSPLAGLTQNALNLMYKLAPAWTVLRVLITLIVGYIGKIDAVINPLALIKWAIKNNRDFIKLEDNDITSEFQKKLNWFIGHIVPTEKALFKAPLIELPEFIKWIDFNFEKITLKSLCNEFNKQCPNTASKWPFIWFFIITDPKKEKKKK